jgi:multiple antibiotic resistance protein
VDKRLLLEVFVTLLVIMDPPGAVPVFLVVTRDLTTQERRKAALMAVLTAFFVITLFAVAGRQILGYLHVTVPALQIAGGLLLLLVALEDNQVEPTAITPEQRTSIGMVPLGTPMLAGPGAIVATIVFAQGIKTGGQWLSLATGIVGVHIILFLSLRFSGLIRRLVRDAGILLITRVAGVLLAAIDRRRYPGVCESGLDRRAERGSTRSLGPHLRNQNERRGENHRDGNTGHG